MPGRRGSECIWRTGYEAVCVGRALFSVTAGLLEKGDAMTEKEMIKISIEEFSRIQDWMLLADKDTELYKSIRKRYIDLKVILTTSGVSLTELDRIKE